MLSSSTVNRLKEKVDQSEIVVEPFPHLLIPDFLERDLYDKALAHWPADSFFAAKNYARRTQFNLGAALEELPIEARDVWNTVLDISTVVNRALYRKFTPYFARKFGLLFGSGWRDIIRDYTTSFRQTQLAQYTGNAGLHPHVDSVRLVVNSFLYASETAEPNPELGTVLFRSFGYMTTENNLRLSEKTQGRFLAPAVRVPYCANYLLSFLNTPFAFHGVDNFDIGERKRRIILLSPTLNKSVDEIEADFHRIVLGAQS